jgi:EAL domain-containing protein (putative c-di-GMP-specific phosphodiesterase class I)/ActR/RegA family two-component response regulator
MTAHATSRSPLKSIMVVDDSSAQRQHAVQLCRQLGIGLVYEAAHGAEALQQLDMLRLPPDVLLIDLHMPVMDGVELITQLHERGQQIPVLVVSSQQQNILNAVVALSSTLGLAMLGTLPKPLQAAALEGALQQVHLCRQSTCSMQALPQALPISATDLCQAIDADGIDVHYQPKVDMRTGLVRGMEVLARWTHPRLGRIAPDQFIALAESRGLIYDLTLRVLRRAIVQAAAWQHVGFTPKLAVNLSPLLLDNPDIVRELTDLVEGQGVSATQLVLEITESAGVEHLGKAIAMLTRLRLKGFGLSLDDYGTGFSSMQQLARLPFTELKIDRSFVHDAHQRRNLSVILESALDMARRLELTSVAEGIETLEDWRLLQRYDCAVGQGYLIAKPMPAGQVPEWLRQHRQRLPLLRAQ